LPTMVSRRRGAVGAGAGGALAAWCPAASAVTARADTAEILPSPLIYFTIRTPCIPLSACSPIVQTYW